MRKISYLVILWILSYPISQIQAQSITFMGNVISFGSTSAEFLRSNPEYKISNEVEVVSDVNVYERSIDLTKYFIYATFTIYIEFYKDKLFKMKINEHWSPDEYIENIRELVKQFEVIDEESDDVYGTFKQHLKKGNLIGVYAGRESLYFECFRNIENEKQVK